MYRERGSVEILRHRFFQLKPVVPYLQHPNNICKHGISCQVKITFWLVVKHMYILFILSSQDKLSYLSIMYSLLK